MTRSWHLALVALIALAGCDKEEGWRRASSPTGPTGKQILFGDLHSHTGYSFDAFAFTLSAFGGKGSRPPMEACHFARFCSQLDFWSINDHSELLTPRQWTLTKEAIRDCNTLTGGNESDPDVVAYLGWEWSNMGDTPADNYGHKNVIMLDTAEDKVPARPIATRGLGRLAALIDIAKSGQIDAILDVASSLDREHEEEYRNFGTFISGALDVPSCAEGVDTRALPKDCREYAVDPHALFEKLDQWGFDSLVIPHGTTWGMLHPPLSNWSHQLNLLNHDPARQVLIEVYSGHGNSEEFRSWWPYKVVEGRNVCPEPTADYLPCCWRAGEITKKTDAACVADPVGAECSQAVLKAQEAYMAGQTKGYEAVPGVAASEWLDCGQCRDCYLPAFKLATKMSVQAGYALTNLTDPAHPLRYRFGMIGSSDEHKATPGTGFREDKGFTDNAGTISKDYEVFSPIISTALGEWEREGSYWYTGGLAAVHSEGRSRKQIWEAMKRKEVYATSGERILLWFDLVGGATRKPMGSEVSSSTDPRFEVTAIGAYKQAPGCADDVKSAAPPGFVEDRCLGECYNPTDARFVITRIEVVRIRPQIRADEPLEGLIEDPWKTLECPRNPEGCKVTFVDDTFVSGGRPSLYYVRAIQEPTEQVNAAGLRCTYDANGNCSSIRPCYAGYRGEGDSCLAPEEERAWSSPIFVEPVGR